MGADGLPQVTPSNPFVVMGLPPCGETREASFDQLREYPSQYRTTLRHGAHPEAPPALPEACAASNRACNSARNAGETKAASTAWRWHCQNSLRPQPRFSARRSNSCVTDVAETVRASVLTVTRSPSRSNRPMGCGERASTARVWTFESGQTSRGIARCRTVSTTRADSSIRTP